MKEEYDALIKELEKIAPFEAYPCRDLVVQLRKEWKITLKTKMMATHFHNFVEAGGICCTLEGLEPLGNSEEKVIICGLTHLIIPESNPLFFEITKYQIKRNKWLAKYGG